VRARDGDELPRLSARRQLLSHHRHLVVSAQARHENIGAVDHFGQRGHRFGATRHRRREPVLVDVVRDDVESAGHHVAAHRQSHVADADDSDHVTAFRMAAGVGPKC